MNSKSTTEYPDYPKGKVVGALDATEAGAVKSALTEAGFAEDRIQSIVAADVEGVETPLTRTGMGGFMNRLLLTAGDDLERLDRMRQELAQGRVLVSVDVEEANARTHVAQIMRDHGGRWINYFGRWTIESLG